LLLTPTSDYMKGYLKLRSYALEQLRTNLDTRLSYHSIHHTEYVLQKVNFLARHYSLNVADRKALRVAALFHDIGFINVYRNHEEEGVRILRNAMLEMKADISGIDAMAGMIMATKIPQSPKTLLDKILCDADLFYLGSQHYYPVAELLRKEWFSYGIVENNEEWMIRQIDFLDAHKFHTTYCLENQEARKRERLAELKSKITQGP